jgi:chromosome segregation ATPase
MSDEVTRQMAEIRAERDAAERERAESRAEVVRLRAECEGLRADLLAHPPDHSARIAELQATIETLREDGKNCEAEYVVQRDKIVELQADLTQVRYERDTALAGFRELQATNAAIWEAQQDMRRKADHDQMIIEGLRGCLERTEGRLSQAKARQIPAALVGLLGVIRREAAAAEKMIL